MGANNANEPLVAVVTGASRGIGAATATVLAARGAHVALLARTERDLASTADRIERLGVRSLSVRCDVASESDVQRAAATVIGELGVPAAVINNAGVIRRSFVQDTSLVDWRAVLDVNLTGPFLVTRAFLQPMMRARRGRFVQVASISATLGTAGAAAYAASKWGVVGFTKTLAEELRGSGLSAMSVLPGSVDTAMLQGSGFSAQMTPEDVAGLIVYAALDAPAAMNGSSIEMFG
jgi:NAD(P)-dependent dehydrogenase (short-subunit alcohol dehydrogenase family)